MKKHLFFIVALVATTFTAHAQISKGNQAIGLSVGTSNTSENYSATNSDYSSKSENKGFNVEVDYSYFVKDKVAIGFKAGYSNYDNSTINNNSTQLSERQYTSKSYTLGFVGKQYFMFGEKFGAFGGANLLGSIYKSENKDLINNYQLSSGDGWNVSLGIQGGIAFFPWKRFSCEAGIAAANFNYGKTTTTSTTNEFTNESKSSGFGLSFVKSLDNIAFTLRYHFGFKK